jgi:hypothetical protein
MGIAVSGSVRTSLAPRIVLILTVLSITAARLHGHTVDAVDLTQEVNRCLRLVKVAASRRQRLNGVSICDPRRHVDASLWT